MSASDEIAVAAQAFGDDIDALKLMTAKIIGRAEAFARDVERFSNKLSAMSSDQLSLFGD